ncbi:hypothetical protein IAT38_008433 [Cryptococcus sp. DSM 104549]
MSAPTQSPPPLLQFPLEASQDTAANTETIINLLRSVAYHKQDQSNFHNARSRHNPRLTSYINETGWLANTPEKLKKREEVRSTSEYVEAVKRASFFRYAQSQTEADMKYTETPPAVIDGRTTGIGLTVYIPSVYSHLAGCKSDDEEKEFLTNLGKDVLREKAFGKGGSAVRGESVNRSPSTVVRSVASRLFWDPLHPLVEDPWGNTAGPQQSPLKAYLESYNDVTTAEEVERIYKDALHSYRSKLDIEGLSDDALYALDTTWRGQPKGRLGTSVVVDSKGMLTAHEVAKDIVEACKEADELMTQLKADGISLEITDDDMTGPRPIYKEFNISPELRSNIQSTLEAAKSDVDENGNPASWINVDLAIALESEGDRGKVGTQDPTGVTADDRKVDTSQLKLVFWDEVDEMGASVLSDVDSFWPKGRGKASEHISIQGSEA